MSRIVRQRPSRKPFLWIEDAKKARCTYLHTIEDMKKDFGDVDMNLITERPPLYCIIVEKVVENHKEKSPLYVSGYMYSNFERVDKFYTFDTAALYRLAYSQAKHYREMIGGGKIKVVKSQIARNFNDVYGTWKFRVFDEDGNKRYCILTEPVYRFCFQPIFDK